MKETIFSVKVGGDFACFTNPGLKVERCSYPVITPSAARGLLEAIFWKPEFRWEIREIKILKPVKYINIMRNEIEDRQSKKPIIVEDKRQQRVSMILKDVEYIINASITLRTSEHAFGKYAAQFQRKLEGGQCHHTPYLGTREFAAWFEPATGKEYPEQAFNISVGKMLFDIAYREDVKRGEIEFHRHAENTKRVAAGYAHALYFDAEVLDNTMAIPREKYEELYRLEGNHV